MSSKFTPFNKIIKHLSSNQLGFESYSFANGFACPLSIKYNKDNDVDILNNVFEILDKGKYSIISKVSTKIEDDKFIVVRYRYEGWSAYYEFDFRIYLVYITDKNEIMLCGLIEQDVHDLFEEIIRFKIIPQWIKDLNFY
jgi:hypothetical protein